MIVFNSFPRSGNVFMSNVANFFNIHSDANHNPQLYYNSSINQCSYFREPKECIASWVYRGMSSAENKGLTTNWEDFSSIDKLITKQVESYKVYINAAKDNESTLYIGDFLNIKKDAYIEILKICNFFNIDIKSRRPYSLETIRENLYSQNYMTDSDGHMPRPKTQKRIDLETYVQQSSLFDEVIDMYHSLNYTQALV